MAQDTTGTTTASQNEQSPATAHSASGGGSTDVTARMPNNSGIGGSTRIADSVVARIAGLATREVPGVHDMAAGGTGSAFAGLAGRMTGQDQLYRGVAVEVGEVECIVDLTIVVDYGASIPQVVESIRRSVSGRLRAMTGLETREINISVIDLHFPQQDQGQGQQQQQPQSVR